MPPYFSPSGLKPAAVLDVGRYGAFLGHRVLDRSPSSTSGLAPCCSADPRQNSGRHLVFKHRSVGKEAEFQRGQNLRRSPEKFFLEAHEGVSGQMRLRMRLGSGAQHPLGMPLLLHIRMLHLSVLPHGIQGSVGRSCPHTSASICAERSGSRGLYILS